MKLISRFLNDAGVCLFLGENMSNRVLSVVCGLFLGVLVLVVLPVHAGNLAFMKSLEMSSVGPSAGVYWISLPFKYTPIDVNTNGFVDAEDLAQDLQPAEFNRPCTPGYCAVERVWTWDPATGEYSAWVSGSSSGTPFELVPGAGYGVEIQTVYHDSQSHSEHVLTLVGAHDPTFEFSDCHTPGGVNMRWISLPPHLAVDASFGTPDVLDAEDLGQAMGGPDSVFQIRRWNETTAHYDNWVVGGSYGTPFAIDLSRAYAVDLSCDDLQAPCSECQWAWTPEHY